MLEAIAIRVEAAIAIRAQALAIRLEAIAIRVEAVSIRLEVIPNLEILMAALAFLYLLYSPRSLHATSSCNPRRMFGLSARRRT